jgi:hypothetical protein
MIAAHTGNARVIRALLDGGASTTMVTAGGPALSAALAMNHEEATQILIDADPGMVRAGSWDPSHEAGPMLGVATSARIAKMLIRAGCPVDFEGADGMTAVHTFALDDNDEVIRELVGAGADVNHGDIRGITPLMQAAGCGHTATVRLLLDSGARANQVDARGNTAEKHAKSRGFDGVVRLLRKRGAGARGAGAEPTSVASAGSGSQPPGSSGASGGEQCAQCGATRRANGAAGGDVSLSRCAKCHVARYCSKACQKSHWKTHKQQCSALASGAAAIASAHISAAVSNQQPPAMRTWGGNNNVVRQSGVDDPLQRFREMSFGGAAAAVAGTGDDLMSRLAAGRRKLQQEQAEHARAMPRMLPARAGDVDDSYATGDHPAPPQPPFFDPAAGRVVRSFA